MNLPRRIIRGVLINAMMPRTVTDSLLEPLVCVRSLTLGSESQAVQLASDPAAGFLGNELEATRWFKAVTPSASPRLPPAAAMLDYVRRRSRKRRMPGLLHRGSIRHLLLFMFVSQPKGQHL
uniref:Uncharacterized protein n=1 Tax=Setaria viridis TaxID=4556 RepID=A0A4U6UIW2_SETVI|nr:hypothetical protein SEVIR_5G182100v2 [Setaria viridis]